MKIFGSKRPGILLLLSATKKFINSFHHLSWLVASPGPSGKKVTQVPIWYLQGFYFLCCQNMLKTCPLATISYQDSCLALRTDTAPQECSWSAKNGIEHPQSMPWLAVPSCASSLSRTAKKWTVALCTSQLPSRLIEGTGPFSAGASAITTHPLLSTVTNTVSVPYLPTHFFHPSPRIPEDGNATRRLHKGSWLGYKTRVNSFLCYMKGWMPQHLAAKFFHNIW